MYLIVVVGVVVIKHGKRIYWNFLSDIFHHSQCFHDSGMSVSFSPKFVHLISIVIVDGGKQSRAGFKEPMEFSVGLPLSSGTTILVSSSVVVTSRESIISYFRIRQKTTDCFNRSKHEFSEIIDTSRTL